MDEVRAALHGLLERSAPPPDPVELLATRIRRRHRRRAIQLGASLLVLVTLVVSAGVALRGSQPPGRSTRVVGATADPPAAPQPTKPSQAPEMRPVAPVRDMALLSSQQGWILSNAGLWWTDDGGGHWRKITPPLNSSPVNVYAVSFLDSNRGWAAVARPEGQVGAAVFATVDGGSSWVEARLPGDFRDGFSQISISFVDPANGWAAVERPHSSGSVGRSQVFATTDGGGTWTEVAEWAPFDGAIRFSDASHGWAVTDTGLQNKLFSSHDGGRNWEEVVLPPTSGYSASSFGLPVFNGDRGILLTRLKGETGAIERVGFYTSDDGGQSWRDGVAPFENDTRRFPTFFPLPFSAVTPQHWVLYVRPTLYVSDDAGASWTPVATDPPGRTITGIQFDNPRHGWARIQDDGCSGLTASCSTLYETDDGGKTWRPLATP